jgi:hypothetical protein
MGTKVFAPFFEQLLIPAFFSDDKKVAILPLEADAKAAHAVKMALHRELKKIPEGFPNHMIAYEKLDNGWNFWIEEKPISRLAAMLQESNPNEQPIVPN